MRRHFNCRAIGATFHEICPGDAVLEFGSHFYAIPAGPGIDAVDLVNIALGQYADGLYKFNGCYVIAGLMRIEGYDNNSKNTENHQ